MKLNLKRTLISTTASFVLLAVYCYLMNSNLALGIGYFLGILAGIYLARYLYDDVEILKNPGKQENNSK